MVPSIGCVKVQYGLPFSSSPVGSVCVSTYSRSTQSVIHSVVSKTRSAADEDEDSNSADSDADEDKDEDSDKDTEEAVHASTSMSLSANEP